MNRSHSSRSNASNAVIAVDCPWCDEPIRAPADELDGGVSCGGCGVTAPWADAAAGRRRLPSSAPLAA